MNILNQIRQGQTASAIMGANNRRKLWDWCKRKSETGKVNVRVYCSGRDGYRVLRDEERVRIGRAVPELRVRPRFDYTTERNVISHTDIVWSYVY